MTHPCTYRNRICIMLMHLGIIFIVMSFVILIFLNIHIELLLHFLTCLFRVIIIMYLISFSSFEDILQLLNPLFKYILMHPTPSSDVFITASHLYTSLLTIAQSDDCPPLPILHILIALLPLTPTHSHQHILTHSNRIEVKIAL